jgi:transcriptional regulator with XRE-family HTH domain
VTGREIRARRIAARITARAVCNRVDISPAKFSDIENENIEATAHELQRIDAAIKEIIQTRQQLEKLAADQGLNLAGVRL